MVTCVADEWLPSTEPGLSADSRLFLMGFISDSYRMAPKKALAFPSLFGTDGASGYRCLRSTMGGSKNKAMMVVAFCLRPHYSRLGESRALLRLGCAPEPASVSAATPIGWNADWMEWKDAPKVRPAGSSSHCKDDDAHFRHGVHGRLQNQKIRHPSMPAKRPDLPLR